MYETALSIMVILQLQIAVGSISTCHKITKL